MQLGRSDECRGGLSQLSRSGDWSGCRGGLSQLSRSGDWSGLRLRGRLWCFGSGRDLALPSCGLALPGVHLAFQVGAECGQDRRTVAIFVIGVVVVGVVVVSIVDGGGIFGGVGDGGGGGGRVSSVVLRVRP